MHVAGAVRHEDLPARLLVGLVEVHAFVVDAHLLARVHVVVDQHALLAADEHLPDLDRRQPVDVEVTQEAVVEMHGDVRDVLVLKVGDAGAVGRYGNRALVDEVVHDRQVVRRKVPDDVRILLEETEVHAHRIQIQQLADVAPRDHRSHGAHRAGVDERVIHHQPHVMPVGERAQLGGLGPRRGQRLFDEHVLVPFDRRLRQRVVGLERRRDDDGVDVAASQHVLRVGAHGDARMPSGGGLLLTAARVGDDGEAQALGVGEISREVGPPVAVADQADVQHRARKSAATTATCFTWSCRRKGCMGSDTMSRARRSVTGKSPTL